VIVIEREETVAAGKNPEWQQRLKMPIIVAIAFLAIGALSYRFYNFRAENQVELFLDDVFSGRFDAAWNRWDASGSYGMNDFLTDWGQAGYYTKDKTSGEIIDSNRRGRSVIVYVSIDPELRPVALIVDNETLRISFSPVNKY
jgi:hypothetical protein